MDLGQCVSHAFAELYPFVSNGTVRRVVLAEGESPVVEYFARELGILLQNELPIITASAPHFQREQGGIIDLI